jgi:hypothetical protein
MTEIKRGMVFKCFALTFGEYGKNVRIVSVPLDKRYVLAYDTHRDRRHVKGLSKRDFGVYYKRVE